MHAISLLTNGIGVNGQVCGHQPPMVREAAVLRSERFLERCQDRHVAQWRTRQRAAPSLKLASTRAVIVTHGWAFTAGPLAVGQHPESLSIR